MGMDEAFEVLQRGVELCGDNRYRTVTPVDLYQFIHSLHTLQEKVNTPVRGTLSAFELGSLRDQEGAEIDVLGFKISLVTHAYAGKKSDAPSGRLNFPHHFLAFVVGCWQLHNPLHFLFGTSKECG